MVSDGNQGHRKRNLAAGGKSIQSESLEQVRLIICLFRRPKPFSFPTPPTPDASGSPFAPAPRPGQRTTPDLSPDFDFSIFPFLHYYDTQVREKRFLRDLRKGVADAKDEVRKARVKVLVARTDLEKYGGLYLRTINTAKLQERVLEEEVWGIWWKGEFERREAWLKGHEQRAKAVKSAEKAKVELEKAREEAREKAMAQERENVKMKAQTGKVEVVEIPDSDEDDEFIAFLRPYEEIEE